MAAVLSCAWTAWIAPGAAAEPSAPIVAWVTTGQNVVVPVDVTAGVVGTPVALDEPSAIAITPDGSTALVASRDGRSVTPVDTRSGQTGGEIGLPIRPHAIGITPDGASAYLLSGSLTNQAITRIDLETRLADPSTAIGFAPLELAITPDGGSVLVSDFAGSVIPFQVATGAPEPAIPVGLFETLRSIAVDPTGTTAYAVNESGSQLVPIDIASRSVGSPVSVPPSPIGLAISPDGEKGFVLSNQDGSVTPVDLVTATASQPISVPDAVDVAVSPDGTTVVVLTGGQSGTVVPVDAATGAVGAPIAVGGRPRDLALVPDQAPEAAFTTLTAGVRRTTEFDASGSTARPGPVARYHWDFGDGTEATTSSPTIRHVYDAAGSYVVTLTTTSAAGTSTDDSFTGRTMSRNGDPGAVVRRSIEIVPSDDPTAPSHGAPDGPIAARPTFAG